MSNEEREMTEGTARLLGGGSAVTTAIGFGVAAFFAFDAPAYAVTVGLLGGVGSFLFLPWFLQLSAAQDEDVASFSEAAAAADRSTQSGVFGLGLELGAIAMFASGIYLGEADPLVGTGIAVVVALAVFLVGLVSLDR